MIVKSLAKVNWAGLKNLNTLDPDEQDKQILICKANTATVLPQLMAFFSSNIKLIREVGEDAAPNPYQDKGAFLPWEEKDVIVDTTPARGLINIDKTLQAFVDKIQAGKVYFDSGENVTLDIFTGMLRLCALDPRGKVLPIKTIQLKSTRYAVNVPLFYSAFKEYRDVGYEEWDWANASTRALAITLDPRTAAIIQLRVHGLGIDISNDELLLLRENARIIRSGAKEGNLRNPQSVTSVYGAAELNPEFNKLHTTVKVMLCQLWIFMPCFRHKLGLYSVTNLDEYPADIVADEVFITKAAPTYSKNNTTSDLPWEI